MSDGTNDPILGQRVSPILLVHLKFVLLLQPQVTSRSLPVVQRQPPPPSTPPPSSAHMQMMMQVHHALRYPAKVLLGQLYLLESKEFMTITVRASDV